MFQIANRMSNLKRKFRGGYSRAFSNDLYNRQTMLPGGMAFGGEPNITETLLNLGNQAQQILDQQVLNQQMDYQRPPKMMKYQTGPFYRGSQNVNPFRGKGAVRNMSPSYRGMQKANVFRGKGAIPSMSRSYRGMQKANAFRGKGAIPSMSQSYRGMQKANAFRGKGAIPSMGPSYRGMQNTNTFRGNRAFLNKGPSFRGRLNANALRGKRAVTKKVTDSQPKHPPYHCIFCNTPTKNRKGHLDHLKTKEHIDTVAKRGTFLKEKMQKLVEKVEAEAPQRKYYRGGKRFCQVCCTYFAGSEARHNGRPSHQEYVFMTDMKCPDCRLVFNDRFAFEKHLLTLDHARNQHFQLLKTDDHVVSKELLEVEDYDPKIVAGYEFIGDKRGYYCQVCEELFLRSSKSFVRHCQSEKHYKNFKEFAKKKLEELEQEKQKKADQQTVEDSSIKVATAPEPKDDDEHMEVGENAENVENEQAGDVQGEETENMEADEAENEDEETKNVEDEEAEMVDAEADNVNEEADNVEGEAENTEEPTSSPDKEADSSIERTRRSLRAK